MISGSTVGHELLGIESVVVARPREVPALHGERPDGLLMICFCSGGVTFSWHTNLGGYIRTSQA